MNKIFLCSLILLTTFKVTESIADDEVSFGVGSSALYNGYGANIAYLRDADLMYISLGCHSLLSVSGSGTSSNCGIGTGWIMSDVLSESKKHGIGVHINVNHNTFNNLNENVYNIGIPYLYDAEGISSGGWHVGFTPAIAIYSSGTKAELWFNWGYQF